MRLKAPRKRVQSGLRISLHLACLLPFLWLAWRLASNDLGVNPVETLLHMAGIWALRLLLICLAVTPLNRLLGAPWLVQYRRALGDWAFFYALLHFSVYLLFEVTFSWAAIADDLVHRSFITLGFLAFVLLVPLAATSNRWAQRRLGRHWLRLHRLIYVAASAAVLHFWWLTKGFQIEPLIYLAILLVLLVARLFARARVRRRRLSM